MGWWGNIVSTQIKRGKRECDSSSNESCSGSHTCNHGRVIGCQKCFQFSMWWCWSGGEVVARQHQMPRSICPSKKKDASLIIFYILHALYLKWRLFLSPLLQNEAKKKGRGGTWGEGIWFWAGVWFKTSLLCYSLKWRDCSQTSASEEVGAWGDSPSLTPLARITSCVIYWIYYTTETQCASILSIHTWLMTEIKLFVGPSWPLYCLCPSSIMYTPKASWLLNILVSFYEFWPK